MASFPDKLHERRDFSASRQALLDRLRSGGGASNGSTIPRGERNACEPMSFAQQRLWFLNQLWPDDGGIYNIPAAWSIRGSLDRQVVQRALDALVARHETLRTTFPGSNGSAHQAVGDPCAVDVHYIDLTEVEPELRETTAKRLAIDDGMRAFCLATGPLFRATLLRLDAGHHFLVLTSHHIICDGWSLGVLERDFTALYEAFRDGRPSPLAPLPIQYADYSRWQREQMRGDVLRSHVDYWVDTLRGLPALNLPTDLPRTRGPRHTGGREVHELPVGLSAALRDLSRREHATVFITLLAAFNALLHRYTRQDDIVVGSPIANRNRAELEGLIGLFVNMLVLRTDVSGDPSFRQLLARVREVALGAFDRQNVPFEKLVEELAPERESNRNPLFSVTFAVQNAPRPTSDRMGRQFESMSLDIASARFDLEVHVWEAAESFRLVLLYNRDLFLPASIQRMLQHYQALLEAVVADPDRPISRLQIISHDERQRLLATGNATTNESCGEIPVHVAFERQATLHPDRVALEQCDDRVSYGELNRRANRLAERLLSAGIGRDAVVALLLERSVDMVTAMLATLKAGGAYAPLDPESPRERLQTLLEDLRPPVVITQESLGDALPPAAIQAATLWLDGDHRDDGQDADNLGVQVAQDDLAYVLYTSGSTGTPKGVMIPHRGLSNHMAWMQRAFPLCVEDRVLQKTPPTFDASVWEFFAPLLAGAQLVLARHEGHKDPEYLVETIRSRGITIFQAVPSLLRLLLATQGFDSCTSLRRFFCGGEPLTRDLADEFLRRLPATLHNLYGPTEATIDATCWTCTPDDDRATVPIGRPIDNVQVYLLDQHMEPVPTGVAGELFLGGAALARGYWNRPELTAEKFVPHPFSPDPAARLYKTGDICRRLAGGELEFLGRRDHQIKLRGYRVELGEIESQLRRHPCVREAVVEVKADPQHNDQLVAYIVPGSSDEDSGPVTEVSSAESERLRQWNAVHDQIIHEAGTPSDLAFNTAGWKCSYTGEAISADEMQESVDGTARRILSWRPQRVLEIGCGTGLILARVAPACERYVGTDFSTYALEQSRRLVQSRAELAHVALEQRVADDFRGFQNKSFDTVILNSVIQYFPSVDYLRRVLNGAANLVAPGGRIFVGDVRSLRLLNAYHASVHFCHADESTTKSQLRAMVDHSISQEEELVVDPEFFYAIGRELPQVTGAVVLAKHGWRHNELTRYRFDAVLDVQHTRKPAKANLERKWDDDALTLESLRDVLARESTQSILVRGIPDARVAPALAVVDWLAADEAPASVGAFRRNLHANRDGVGPDDLRRLAESLDFQIDFSYCRRRDGALDAFIRRNTGALVQDALWPGPAPVPEKPWRACANRPLVGSQNRELAPVLRDYLKRQLPDYMIPAAFVVLDRLPLAGNGKLDRAALPAPGRFGLKSSVEFIAARNALEARLASLWSETLGVDRVGVHDNFFELGGHSLLATQLISRVRDCFRVDLPLASIFDDPTVASFAERHIQDLERSANPRQSKDASAESSAGLVRAPRDGKLPLSFGQQRLWFIDKLFPESCQYNMQLAVQLAGPVDVAALESALSEIIRRHEALRTQFHDEDGTPFQVVVPHRAMPLVVEDFPLPTDAERLTALRSIAAVELKRPFDLSRDMLIRCRLLRFGRDEHALLLTMHHIICDGWSMGVMFRELAEQYQAYLGGRPSGLDELEFQYVDFAAWQRRTIDGPALHDLLTFWKARLAGAVALELPFDQPRTSVPTFDGSMERLELPKPLAVQLKQLGDREGATLFMVLLAAFKVLLARYSGQPDVVVGVPIAGRNRSELEPLIGFFVNTLAMRTDLGGDPPFRELLARVRETAISAYDHQDMPFERLVEELDPDRDLSRNPFFQILFAVQNAPRPPREMSAVTLKLRELPIQPARFDLEFHVSDRQEGLSLGVVYNAQLFVRESIARMLGHYESLLQEIVADPGQAISRLSMMTDGEREQLLVASHCTTTHGPDDATIVELFEKQVDLTPDAAAIVCEGQSLSYRDLNARANCLARRLSALGAGPGEVVAICIRRGAEMAVGVVGTLKSGAAYAPLDPDYPASRLEVMLEDAHARIVVTQRDLASRLPYDAEQLVFVDGLKRKGACCDSENLAPRARPEDLAYVIFTSGSTGRPKGVAMPHAPLVNLIRWQNSRSQIASESRTLQFASLGFDVSFQEMFSTWCFGGTLVMVDESLRRDVHRLIDYVDAHRVERIFLPYVALQQLAEHACGGAKCGELRTVITAGEPLQCTPSIRKFFSERPKCRLLNQYGPTETHVVSEYELPANPADWPMLPPIGKPIANVRLYVLDEHAQLTPIGIPGELHIGGVGIAKGYLNRPQWTADRFVKDPFSSDDGARMYKTGDVVRILNDGNLQFLGRRDDQVKVRGFRIELGEVESAIGSAPNVAEAAAAVHSDTSGVNTLVGYVVLRDAGRFDLDAVKRHVGKRLPKYMVPSAFVRLDRLPLTPSGKLDRRSLPPPEAFRAEMVNEYVAPRNDAERRLARVWSDVLGVEEVGVHDDFFALGGHSLLATQVVARVREAFRVELPLAELFAVPTIAELARSISSRLTDPIDALPLQAGSARPDRLPLSFGQQRLWFMDQIVDNGPAYNLPTVFRLDGRLDAPRLRLCLNALVARHESLRTVLRVIDGEPSQVILEPFAVEMPVVDLSDLPRSSREAKAHELVADEAHKRFDLATGPLVRATLFRLDERLHLLLLTMHHAVVDGWSLGILFTELAALYGAPPDEQPPALPPTGVQYADFAVWQREAVEGAAIRRQMDYWREQLAGAPSLELPVDYPRPKIQSLRGSSESLQLPKSLLAELESLSQREGATLFMTLLAAFKVMLCRYCSQTDVAVGTLVANRNRAETERTVGFFVNTLVLRTEISGDPTFCEVLSRVRRTSLEAFDAQDLPFDKLVEELDPERDLTRNPIFQALFALQNAPAPPVRLGDLDMVLGGARTQVTRFDLEFHIWTNDGLRLAVVYARDLFKASTIRRMLGHYQTLLEAIVQNPTQRISELPLLTDAERSQLAAWNEAAEFSASCCIDALFEQTAARHASRTALQLDDREMSYGELNSQANQLARHLRDRGVGAGALVGLCTERSFDLAVGMLGILKTGAAYVPLEPSLPDDRLAWMIEDTQMPVVVTHETTRRLFADRSVETVCLDGHRDAIVSHSAENLDNVRRSTGDVAYAIYTSGSTGRPKGVLVTHANVARLFAATEAWFQFDSSDVWTLFHSFAFDFSVWELWGALLYGGRLVIVPVDVARSPKDFYALTARAGVTVLNQTPSAFRQYIEADAAAQAELALRYVIFGGEKLSFEMLRPWFARHGEDRPELINMYGITETTVHVTYHRVTASQCDESASVVGRPIPDLQVYILDDSLQPVPIGVPGELCVAGAGVAQGYLRRPELTAARFAANPFGGSTPLYRSGDFGRFRDNGDIEYLGRRDAQIKIRGYRVELGEIESALMQCPNVSQCVVALLGQSDGQLAAYVKTHGGTVDADEVRSILRARLPDYMIPSSVTVLRAFPLTPNGKLDRQALPAPQLGGGQREFTPPRTETEQRLADIWRRLLNVEDVGAHDNFFKLGGHSLRAARMAARVADCFGVDLPVRQVFETPELAELALRIESLKSTAAVSAIPKAVRDRPLPLSFAQLRMWFLDQFEQDRATYNVPVSMRLKGSLDGHTLEAALNHVVSRHEALRTRFPAIAGEPVQEIVPVEEAWIPIERIDPTSVQPGERSAQIARLLREEARRPFDLARGPLMRASLYAVSGDEHVLAIVLHHIVCDEWSIGLLLRELGAAYAALQLGAGLSQTELPLQYADFAAWQRTDMAGERGLQQLAYWKEQLADAPSLLELPTDHARPARQTFRGGRHGRELPQDLAKSLAALGQQCDATLFMTLLAAFQILLMRLTGQSDVVVGAPAANRSRSEVQSLIGMFLNTLALRSRILDEMSFQDVLAEVRARTRDAFANQECPFEKIIDELKIPRQLSHAPLFQAMFILVEDEAPRLDLPNVRCEPVGVDAETAKFDLTLAVVSREGRYAASWEYNRDLFEPETIDRWSQNFEKLLRSIVAEPDRPVVHLPLLADDERRCLLGVWNDTAARHSMRTLMETVAAQTVRTPAKTAVVFKETRLTYAELDRRSNQLAHHLRLLGVDRGTLVGVCVERSADLAVSVLGILKAGGGYVPLDPEFPRERLTYMVRDSGAQVVVTQERLEHLATTDVARVCIDRDWSAISAHGWEAPAVSVASDDLCYVIYTSGSTGRPKGVEITHGALANFLQSMLREPGMTASDSLLSVTTISFDIAALELYLPLLAGGSVEIVDRATAADGRLLADKLQQSRPTIMQATPATWRMLLAAGADLSATKVLCGGEALDEQTAVQLHAASAELWNLYGPTETTIWSLATRLDEVSGTPPIGRPIDNTQAYVLDAHGEIAPIGVPGELYLGGDGLAQGYWRQPQLTKEKFREHRLPDGRRQKLYATGDQARRRADGQLEFLGRRDQQVKIRGYRVELGEIEAVVSQFPGVQHSAVVLQRTRADVDVLVAYVVVHDDAKLDAPRLRDFVGEQLPTYMTPTRYIALDALPLTLNGKVDRRTLSLRDDDASQTGGSTAPRTITEAKLVAIWSDLLHVDRIGTADNFFQLGGESLLAVQLMSRIESEFDARLPVAILFENATIEQLAKVIDQSPAGGLTEVVRIKAGGSKPPLFLVHGMGGDLMYTLPLIRRFAADQPAYGLQSVDMGLVSFEDMARRLAESIRQAQPQGPYCLGGYCYGGMLAYETARQLRAQGADVSLLVVVDTFIVPKKRTLANRAHIVVRFLKNLPFRLATDLYYDRPDRLLRRIKERVALLARDMLGRVRKTDRRRSLEDLIDVDRIRPGEEAMWERNFKALANYRPAPYDGKMVVVRAHTRPLFNSLDHDLGWSLLVKRNLHVRVVAGHHGNLFEEPQVGNIADILSAELAAARPAAPSSGRS